MAKLKHINEPVIQISKRIGMPAWKAWLIRLAAVALALAVNGLLMFVIADANPFKAYASMIDGSFSTLGLTWAWIRDTMRLLCIAVALAPAFKMRFWNIGAEGQILVGGIASVACMIYLNKQGIPNGVLLLIMAAASMLAGALWGVIPAVFKAKFNTNETLFTLMMNYVALQLLNVIIPFWDTKGNNNIDPINTSTKLGWFPSVFGQKYMLNLIIVMALVVGMYFYLRSSKHGYEIAVVGESSRTAKYAAINVNKVIVRTMTLSGALCGLAGYIAVAGQEHTISADTSGGRGFVAIIVAWLAKFNTFAMVLVAALLVFLDKGATTMASDYARLNDDFSYVMRGILLFFILGSEFFINYRIRVLKAKEATAVELGN